MFNPSWQLNTVQLLALSPLSGIGERIRRVKFRKLVGWNKDNSTGKAKAVCASKAKQGIHSLVLISGQVFSHLQESRGPSGVEVTWENKTPSPRTSSPSFFLLQIYVLSTMSYGLQHPFGQLGSAVTSVSPPSLLCTPTRWQTNMTSWKVLAYLATTKNFSMRSTFISSQIQTTELHQLLGRKLTPSQLKLGHCTFVL